MPTFVFVTKILNFFFCIFKLKFFLTKFLLLYYFAFFFCIIFSIPVLWYKKVKGIVCYKTSWCHFQTVCILNAMISFFSKTIHFTNICILYFSLLVCSVFPMKFEFLPNTKLVLVHSYSLVLVVL